MRRSINSKAGFSLVEMLVVMVLSIIVLIITTSALQNVLSKGTVVLRSEESNITGIVGLEMFRHDLTHAGFGLFTNTDDPPAYKEASENPPSNYNDAGKNPSTPRAIVTGNNLTSYVLNNTDYLAVKGTNVSNDPAVQRSNYFTSDSLVPQADSEGLQDTDIFIALEQTYDRQAGEVRNTLIKTTDGKDQFFATSVSNVITSNTFTPPPGKRYYLYGISSDLANVPIAPFNRADFYVRRHPNISNTCSQDTGVFYKAVMRQSNGTLQEIPLLNCVADMQVVLGWNTQPNPTGNNQIDVYTDASGAKPSVQPANGDGLNGLDIPAVMADPSEVRRRLRQVRIYFLVQDGAADMQFFNSNKNMRLAEPVNGAVLDSLVRHTSLVDANSGYVDLTTANKLHYRWKVYYIVLKPKNLN